MAEMKIAEFYKQFNQIVSNHKSVADTKAKLTKLNESIKGTDLESKVNIDINIANELENQRIAKEKETEGLVSIEEKYEDDYYDDSYDNSYDEDED